MSDEVYFIAAGDFQKRVPVKIGTTRRSAESRLAGLQVSHWRQLHLVAVVPGDRLLERRLHDRFAADRIRGEWFWASDRMRDLVAEMLVARMGELREVEAA